jgi:hypothetical protein
LQDKDFAFSTAMEGEEEAEEASREAAVNNMHRLRFAAIATRHGCCLPVNSLPPEHSRGVSKKGDRVVFRKALRHRLGGREKDTTVAAVLEQKP